MRVLIATDGSPASTEAARWVGENVPGLEEVIIAAFYHVPVPLREITVEEWRVLLEEARGEGEGAVEEAREAVQEAWARRTGGSLLPVETIVRATGGRELADEIAELAVERQVDLIAMGSRGLTGLKGLFAGSVSQGVLHRSRVPVLVVPRSAVAVAAG